MIGEKLLHYEITARLGEGGMGEVYRATDTRLNREVAIKVLPEAFVEDTERLARFDREAKLLASLSHPNIGGIFGLEESDPHRFLVLELIEGDTLAERLAGGSIPLGEALPIALQIADALQAAHAQGIVHRDLKPANIKLAPGGPSGPTVKVLDFGLAKAWEQPGGAPDLTLSPTLSAQMTQVGVILGTASYMSPEQARGQEADKRADIWSFGVVLFEMLAGGRIYGGDTVTDILGAIVHKDPDWSVLPPNLPAGVTRLLKRCLEKDRAHRLQDIGDARLEIEEALEGPVEVDTAQRQTNLTRWLPWSIAALALMAAGWALMRGQAASPAEPQGIARYTVLLPNDHTISRTGQSVALSPDGKTVAVTSMLESGGGVFLRSRESFEVRRIEGTEGSADVFFSPDGRWLGFVKDGEIRKVSLAGGTPSTLSGGAPEPYGAAWGDDGTIVFAGSWGGTISRVPAAGGVPEALTRLDRDAGEAAHLWPEILPGSQTVLYTAWSPLGGGQTSIVAFTVGTRETEFLLPDARVPRYSATGHLLFMRGGTLMAVPFDAERVELQGDPVPLEEDVRRYSNSYGAVFDVSADGDLVFQGGGEWEAKRELVWVDRRGHFEPALEDQRDFARPTLSPDGQRLAVTVRGPVFNIWVYDLVRGTRGQLTREADNGAAEWLPVGNALVHWSNLGGPYGIYQTEADGSSAPTLLVEAEGDLGGPAISPDGRTLIFENTPPGDNDGLFVLDLEQEGEVVTFVDSDGNDRNPEFVPDGRWVAFQSDQSGRVEIYVAPFPGPGATWLVSSGGGHDPEWSRDGRELYYWQGNKFMAVAVDAEADLRLGKPEMLFESDQFADSYAVGADGRFFMVRQLIEEGPEKRLLDLVLNWPGELVN